MRSPKPEGTACARHSLPQGESHPERTEGRPRGASRQDLRRTRMLPERFGAHACSSLPRQDEQQTDSKLRALRAEDRAPAQAAGSERPCHSADARARAVKLRSAPTVPARANEPTDKPPSTELRGRITFDMSGSRRLSARWRGYAKPKARRHCLRTPQPTPRREPPRTNRRAAAWGHTTRPAPSMKAARATRRACL